MVKWSIKDVERVTGKKLDIKPNSKIPTPTPAGILFIKNHLTLLNIDFVTELVFSKKRKFRFDIAIPSLMISAEYEGIQSKKSRHTSLTGYTKDTTKYNLAQVEGWIVLRYTALNYLEFKKDLKKAMEFRQENRIFNKQNRNELQFKSVSNNHNKTDLL